MYQANEGPRKHGIGPALGFLHKSVPEALWFHIPAAWAIVEFLDCEQPTCTQEGEHRPRPCVCQGLIYMLTAGERLEPLTLACVSESMMKRTESFTGAHPT